jgi:hypothetical protein
MTGGLDLGETPGEVLVAAVPRVARLEGASRDGLGVELADEPDLAPVGRCACHPVQCAHMPLVGREDEVHVVELVGVELAGPVLRAVVAVRGEDRDGPGVGVLADVPVARAARGDLHQGAQAGVVDEALEDDVSHGGPADVAAAHERDMKWARRHEPH